MTKKNPETNDNGFLAELARELGELWRAFRYALSISGLTIRNLFRRLRGLRLDYVVIPLSGPLHERSGPPRSFIQRQLPLPPEPLSLETLNRRLAAITDATNVNGVVFIFQGLSGGLGTLQNLRQAMTRLRDAGKEVVIFTPYVDLRHYFVASAANRLIIPPTATFDVLGLRAEAVYLKDALSKVGVQAEVIQISPYKTAGNMLTHTDMTPEEREQLNWLLDDTYDVLTSYMAEGRSLEQETILALIDRAPLTAEAALAGGLVDDLAYEDTLPFLLAQAKDEKTERNAAKTNSQPIDEETRSDEEIKANEETKADEETKTAPGTKRRRPKARMLPWSQARSLLLEKARRPVGQYIGIVSLEGDIVMGSSRQSPVDIPIPIPFSSGIAAGEETITQMLRRVERDQSVAALILHVDSNGGSALASDLIWRQIHRIAQKKPVLSLMGNAAASGGYYVAAPANHIMAQPTTITGSIGVLITHVTTAGLFEKFDVNRVTVSKGERALLGSDVAPLNDEERQVLWDGVVETYNRFKDVVATGRQIDNADLDDICGGRVWTGRQALERNLVDSHGDFVDAIRKAAEMADLPLDDDHEIEAYNVYAKGRSYLPPRPFEPAGELLNLLSINYLRQFLGRPLLVMPFDIKFW